MKIKKLTKITILPLIIFALFIVGPKEKNTTLSYTLNDTFPNNLIDLQDFITTKEASINGLKQDNEARIIWANPDSISKTDYAFVYLHGFSASPQEANGIYPDLSSNYNSNIYLPRLQAHGTETENNLLDFDIEKYWKSAQEAYLIGKKLGNKVILVGTSTGGTLALMLAAEYSDIEAIILYSPNIDLYDSKSFILSMPWGLQITRLFYGGKQRSWEATDEQQKYWQCTYRLEALVRLKTMLNQFMTKETFEKIDIPVFIGYYYKNENEHDEVVSIDAMKTMYKQISTNETNKYMIAFPNANDHVLTWLPTAKALDEVKAETFNFLDSVVGITN